MCEFHLPIYDEESEKFVEPYLPNNPIAIMHLAGLDEIRNNRSLRIDIETINGKTIKKSLRYNV